MNFYDDDIREFELYFAVDAGTEWFQSYVRFTPAQENTSFDFLDAKYANERFVIKYLNGESFLGVCFRSDLTPIQSARFASYRPSATEEWTLRMFIDGAIIGENPVEFRSLARGNTFSYTSKSSAEFVSPDEETSILALKHRFTRPYDLFLCECFEMLRSKQKIDKCTCCGKYYYPTSGHARKYCSDHCRIEANSPKTSADIAYRKADNTKARYANRNKADLTIQQTYAQWKREAFSAKLRYERGEIGETEFRDVLSRDIKKARDI